MTHDPSPPSSPVNRWLAFALTLSALLLLGWLGWRAVRTGLYARAALDDLDRLEAVLAKPSLSALPQARADLASLQTHLTEARAAAGPFLRIAPALGWLPRYGAEIVAAPGLLDMAVELSMAGRIAADALAPIGDAQGGGGALAALPAAVDALATGQPALEEASLHIARAAELRATLPLLSEPKIQRQIQRLDKLLPLAEDGLALAQAAPALLGSGGSRTYLLLAQNSDELRATGGFISGAGHVTIDRGELTDLVLKDSYAVDNWQQPHPQPPDALRTHMAADLWVLRDSNWFPDFPTSADVARALYAQDQGIETDGAVALDLEAVRELVGGVGPLQVPGVDEPVTAANALQWMKAAWQSPTDSTGSPENPTAGDWWTKRKDFMGELVKAMLAKMKSGADVDEAVLAKTIYALLDQRHLQIAVDDPAVSAVLAARGWDGSVRLPQASDFLLVVDSNVGFNKANMLVREALDYRVEEAAHGLQATVTIAYTHTASLEAEPECDRTSRYGATYNDLATRCFWDYLRVYVPSGAELLDAEGLGSVASEPAESDATTFTGDFVLKTGATHTVVLRYRLPASVTAHPYRLFVRKQAGTPGWPLAVDFGDCRAQATLATDFRYECPATAGQAAADLQP